MTFKQFHKAEEKSTSVFQTKNFDPFKIMVIVFVIVFIFVFSKGIEVLTNQMLKDLLIFTRKN